MKSLFINLFTILLLVTPPIAVAQKSFMDNMGSTTNLTLKSTVGFYHHEALQEKINQIGTKVEQQFEKETKIKFFILDTDQINAYATFGGYVYITRGLLALIESEDELAGIIAHELTHIDKHHTTEKFIRSILPTLLKIPGGILESAHLKLLGKALKFPVDISLGPINAAFDKRQEYQADKIGAEMTTKAGYNPMGLEIALDKIKKYQEIMIGYKEHFRFMNDHPLTNHRIEHIDKVANHEQHIANFTSMLPLLDGLMVGPNPDYGIYLDNNIFVHSKLNLQIEFNENWIVQTAPESMGAYRLKQKSTIIGHVDYFNSDKKELANHYRKEHEKDKKTIITEDSLTINGFKTHRITLKKTTGEKTEYTQTNWVYLPELKRVLVITSITKNEEAQKEVNKIISSFGPLKEENANRVNILLLHSERSKEETLAEFVGRKNALHNLKWIEGVNQKDADTKLKKETTKWVSSKPYKYKK